MKQSFSTRVALFGVGLDTYWPQFEGLHERLLGYQATIAQQLGTFQAEVFHFGLVDDPTEARAVAQRIREARVDIVVLYISTYAVSHNVLPIAQAVDAPLVVLNAQPTARIDYKRLNSMGDRGKMTGEWLAYCQACVAPEIANVMKRAGITFRLLTGHLEEDYLWQELREYVCAAGLVSAFRQNRIGVMGHYYNGMLDVYADLTRLAATTGCHFELIEFGALKGTLTHESSSLTAKREEFATRFDVSPACEEAELDRAAKTAVALDRLVAKNRLDALAYYFEGDSDPEALDLITSVIPGLTLLTAKNVPVAGECEVKNVLAMKIMDMLGAGGSFSEPYAIDFEDEVVLWGHDGPAHVAIAEGSVGLVPVPVFHGKPGKGLSIQMSVKHGPVTLLSVCEGAQGEVYLMAAEGESVAGPTLQIGNTNSRYKFACGARAFVNAWSNGAPAHHCAIGTGHHLGFLRKLADFWNIRLTEVG